MIANLAYKRLQNVDRTVGIETHALKLGDQEFVVWDYGGQYEVRRLCYGNVYPK
jgi:hypothetical protein